MTGVRVLFASRSVVSVCPGSLSPLPPCLSLLLSSYPLTHILVITSGVPCRNSIAPSTLLLRHKSVFLSLSTGPAFHLHESDKRRCLFFSSAPQRGSCLPDMPFDPSCQLTWSPAAGLPAPRACLMLTEALKQVYLTGARGHDEKPQLWMCVCHSVWAEAPGLLSYRGAARYERSPVWRR